MVSNKFLLMSEAGSKKSQKSRKDFLNGMPDLKSLAAAANG